MGAEAVTFRSRQEIVFGVGAEERVLEDCNWPLFVQLLTALRNARHPYGPRHDRLFRMHPERWLESLVRADASVIDERLETRVGIFAGPRVLRGRSGNDRRADADPRGTAGSRRVESG
jgi:hypothetical protein